MERLVAVMGSVSGGIWKDLFHLQVPWEEKVIRALVVYAFLLLALRSSAGASSASSRRSISDNSLLGGLIGATVHLTVNLGLAYAVFRSRSFQRFVTGEPRILIQDGVLQKQALAAQRLTEQDLLAAVHNQGLEDFSLVRLAISEPNGTISVIPMRE